MVVLQQVLFLGDQHPGKVSSFNPMNILSMCCWCRSITLSNPCRCIIFRSFGGSEIHTPWAWQIVNMIMASPCLVTGSAVSLWPVSECAFGRRFTLQPLLTGSWVRCLASAEVQSRSSVWVWSYAAPPGEQEPCRYIMTTSWLAGIKPLCLDVWRMPWKVQHHVFGDSHNETFLCLLWSELMAFPL